MESSPPRFGQWRRKDSPDLSEISDISAGRKGKFYLNVKIGKNKSRNVIQSFELDFTLNSNLNYLEELCQIL